MVLLLRPIWYRAGQPRLTPQPTGKEKKSKKGLDKQAQRCYNKYKDKRKRE